MAVRNFSNSICRAWQQARSVWESKFPSEKSDQLQDLHELGIKYEVHMVVVSEVCQSVVNNCQQLSTCCQHISVDATTRASQIPSDPSAFLSPTAAPMPSP